MSKILNPKNPRWTASGGIELDVTLELGNGLIDTTIHVMDNDAATKELYQRASAGEFGEVGPIQDEGSN